MEEAMPAPEEDDGPEIEVGDDDEVEETEDEGGDEYVPPTKEEFATIQAALKKANDQAAKQRLQLREAKRAAEKEPGTEDEVEKAKSETAAAWKPRVVKSAAKAALLNAGAEKPERLLRLLDDQDLEVTDDGEVEGLDDAIESLRTEYPELFGTPGKPRRRVETGDRGDGRPKAKSASERQAAGMMGG